MKVCFDLVLIKFKTALHKSRSENRKAVKMAQRLNEPLIGGGATNGEQASVDPFYVFKDELQARQQKISMRFQDWKGLLETTNTHKSRTFKTELDSLRKEIPSLLSNVTDLEQVVNHVSSNRAKFSHISDDELTSRVRFVNEMKQTVTHMDTAMRSQRTMAKMENDERESLLHVKEDRRGQFESAAAAGSGFAGDQQMMQDQIMNTQDQHLDELESGLGRVRNMGEVIHTEIESQNRMLGEFGDDLTATKGRMENMLGRMDKMLKTKSRFQTYTIILLIVTALILLFLVSYT